MLKVILVDDSATARMMIGKCVEISLQGDVEILEAADGIEAIKAMKAMMPDVIISDLNMPGMDGEKLLTTIKSTSIFKHLPVIIISSAGNPKREEQLLKLGAERVLQKPITPPVLAKCLDTLIENGVIQP